LAEGGGFYVGASAGQSSAGLSSDDYRNDLQGVGINARNVSLDDSDTAWKAYAGYSFNEYFAVEAGYTNLGQMESEYTTTMIRAARRSFCARRRTFIPTFAAGATLAIVGRCRWANQFDLFRQGRRLLVGQLRRRRRDRQAARTGLSLWGRTVTTSSTAPASGSLLATGGR
jgi:hypothetical protein